MKNSPCVSTLALVTVFLVAGAWGVHAADRFSLAFGARDMLVVKDAAGAQKAELPLPSISESVTVDNATFDVSYGRDANGLLTAIVSPSPAEPQDLHFSVLGKSIDSDKLAVVTLTFATDKDKVAIDPGYVGDVRVNSHRLDHDSASNRPMQHADVAVIDSSAGDSEAGAPHSAVAAASATVPAAAITAPPITTPVPNPGLNASANQSANMVDPTQATEGHVSDHAPLPMEANDASQMPFTATATPGPSTVSASGPETSPRQHMLYWAEPITSPDGSHPEVGSSEMKLVELKGSVAVTAPGGREQDGQNGMLVPSGSTIHTSGGSSVALFMGGVNSIRLMPDTEVQVTQNMNGGVRKTVVALHSGTIFNRVGRKDGEKQNYQVQSPEGVAVAKGTEFADTLANGHHYVFVVKGIVWTLINGVQTGNLTPTNSHLALGSMPPSTDGDKVLFAILTSLQPFQTKLQQIITDINNHTATPSELGYFDNLRNTFSVAVDDVYDPTHPNSFLGAFTSQTGFGDSTHSDLERPQDFATPNPLNNFNGLFAPTQGQGSTSLTAPAQTAGTLLFATAAVSAVVGSQAVDSSQTSDNGGNPPGDDGGGLTITTFR